MALVGENPKFKHLTLVWTVQTPCAQNGGMNQCLIYLCATLLILVSSARTLAGQATIPTDECGKTAGMEVYSNVFVHEETGDVLGYDLALKRHGDIGVAALFYVYEGGNSDEGVPLSGQISNKHLSVQGTWVEHLVEYPPKKRSCKPIP